jgi:hypothetical protein
VASTRAVLLSLVSGALLSIGGSGCGPIESTSYILKADTALHHAKTAEADRKSPYEYTAAQQLLHKAREKWGTSDYEYSIDYAKDALDMADKAAENAQKPEE